MSIKFNKIIEKFPEKYWPLYLFVLGLLVSLPQMAQPMLSEGDAYARSIIAAEHAKRGILFDSYPGTWLPVYFTIFSIPLRILNDLHLIPRITTLIFSAGSIAFTYLYTRLFFRKKIALIAALFFLFLPIRLSLATVTLTEPVFIFFILSALYLTYKDKPNFVLGGILINFAHGIRYESWLIMPFLLVHIISMKKAALEKKLLIAVFYLSFPIYWLLQNFLVTSDALNFFIVKYESAQSFQNIEYGHPVISFLAWWKELIFVYPVSIIVIFFIGAIFQKGINKKSHAPLAILPIYLFLLLVVQVITGSMEWFPNRYLLIPICLSIPFVANGVWVLAKKLASISRLFFIILLMTTGIMFTSWSILGLEKYQQYNLYASEEKWNDVNQIISKTAEIRKNYNSLNYYHLNRNRFYLDQAFFYFLEIVGTRERPRSAISFEPRVKNSLLIVERAGGENTKNFDTEFKVLYTNSSFFILTPLE